MSYVYPKSNVVPEVTPANSFVSKVIFSAQLIAMPVAKDGYPSVSGVVML
jgi:hypothetical protein